MVALSCVMPARHYEPSVARKNLFIYWYYMHYLHLNLGKKVLKSA